MHSKLISWRSKFRICGVIACFPPWIYRPPWHLLYLYMFFFFFLNPRKSPRSSCCKRPYAFFFLCLSLSSLLFVSFFFGYSPFASRFTAFQQLSPASRSPSELRSDCCADLTPQSMASTRRRLDTASPAGMSPARFPSHFSERERIPSPNARHP